MRWLRDGGRAHDDLGATGCSTSVAAKSLTSRSSHRTRSYVGVDPVENPRAELRGPVEALPVDDGSFDVVLCNQVLEHVDDPALAIRELFRVVARAAGCC